MVIKRMIYIIFLIVGSLLFLYYPSSINANSMQNDIEKVVKNIEKECKKINSDTNLIVVKKELKGLSTEGGVLSNYYNKEGLKKAVLIFYGEMGKRIEEYYFKDKKLILLFKKEFYYNQPFYVEDGFKIEKNEDNRYYFCDEKLIRWFNTELGMRDVHTAESKKISFELILTASEILNLMKE